MKKGGTARDRRLGALGLVLAITCLCGLLFKSHCLPGGWRNTEQYTTGCYSDVVPFWRGREVQQGKIPYFETRMEYPVLTGAQIWAEGALTPPCSAATPMMGGFFWSSRWPTRCSPG